MRPGSSLGYQAGLDGLRAVAVLAVLAYHSGLLPGGWLGVDIFFTLSGFLITTLLVEEHARTGTLSIRGFYERRARRLLPALAGFLLVWVPIALLTLPSAAWPRLGSATLGVIFYVSNWDSIYGPQFYGARAWGAFGHTWSLAIEEQFYLLWPLLLWASLRWAPRRLTWGLAAAAVGSLLWRGALGWAAISPPRRLYAGTDTHADGLLLGAACAVWLVARGSAPGTRVPAIASWTILGALLVTGPVIPGYVWGITGLVALATCGVMVGLLDRPGVLAWRLPVALGRISYGVYLWHWAVFWQLGVARVPGDPVAPVASLALAWSLTLAAAWLSYVLIERRWRVARPAAAAWPSPAVSRPVA
jgi:peptidoglycan/LPS O-acetylase OafA/YrhL